MKAQKQESTALSFVRERPNLTLQMTVSFVGYQLKMTGKKEMLRSTKFARSTVRKNLHNHAHNDGHMTKWAETVRSRIEFVQDLHTADALYHNQCNNNFRTNNKRIPLAFRRSTKMPTADVQKGRPEDAAWAEAFTQVVRYFAENDDEQITIADLCEKMKEYLNGDTPYTEKYMRMKLESHFGEDVIITCIRRKQNVVTFWSTAEKDLGTVFKICQGERRQQQKKEKKKELYKQRQSYYLLISRTLKHQKKSTLQVKV